MTTVERPRDKGTGLSETLTPTTRLGSAFVVGMPAFGRSTVPFAGSGGSMNVRAAPRRGELPVSLAAEQALLGCVLIDEFEVWGELEEFPITAEDFFAPEHKAIWRAFRWLYEQGMDVTWPSTCYALDQMGTVNAIDSWLGSPPLPGVESYLVELAAAAYSAKGCGAFMRMVQHYSALRGPENPRTAREIGL